jgi:hypothetical protein
MKVSALSLSAVRVHAAVSPAEETARAKRAWLLMPPYRAGIIAPALLCRLGSAPLILRLATVAKWPTPKADLFPAKRLPRGLSGKEVYDLATRPASSFASAAPTDSACTSFSTSEPLNCRSPSVGAS